MGLGFSGFFPSSSHPLGKQARTHAQEMAELHRRHLEDLRGKRSEILDAAKDFDAAGDSHRHMRAMAIAADIDISIERAEANLGEWSTS